MKKLNTPTAMNERLHMVSASSGFNLLCFHHAVPFTVYFSAIGSTNWADNRSRISAFNISHNSFTLGIFLFYLFWGKKWQFKA